MAPIFIIVALFGLTLHVTAQGGTQFITGPCSSDADCAAACCGFTSGKCAGPAVAQERDGGCGFGDAQPNDNALQALNGDQPAGISNASAASASVVSVASAPAASGTSPAKAAGTQFITGACTSDADCASSCCGFKSGKCAGPAVAQERDGGCGFGDAQPNDAALQALQSGATKANVQAAAAPTSAPAATSAAVKAAGTQFITGACTSDASCASSCCGFKSGKCAGPAVAQERDGGCGFGDAQPNDTALQAPRGQ